MINNSTLIKSLKNINPQAQFAMVKGYKPATKPGKIADYNLIINVDYRKALEKSLKILKKYNVTSVSCNGKPFSQQDLQLAKEELLLSIQNSLESKEKDLPNPYIRVTKNSKLDLNSGIVHLFGFILQEKLIQPQLSKKERRSSRKTLAKNYLRNLLPCTKYVQFRLTAENCEAVHVQNSQIIIN